MTERLMSYLSQFTDDDHYAAPGIFQGSLPDGFYLAVLVRDTMRPSPDGFSKIYVSNYEPSGANLGRGWAMRIQRDVNRWRFDFEFADVDLALTRMLTGYILDSMVSYRTMLISVAFGMDLGSDPRAMLFINGQEMSIQGEDELAVGNDILNGYTPATPGNPFRLGAGITQTGGSPNTNNAGDTGIAGFAWGGLPTSEGEELFADVTDLAATHFQACAAADDMVAPEGALGDLITDIYSVRRGLPELRSTWTATRGATALARQGSASLVVGADKPKFHSAYWRSDPLGIASQATLVAIARVQGDGTLLADDNISSVVRNGAGDYTVNLSAVVPTDLPLIPLVSLLDDPIVSSGEISSGGAAPALSVLTYNSAGVAADHGFTLLVYRINPN